MCADRLKALNVPVAVLVVTNGGREPLAITETAGAANRTRRVTHVLETWRVDDEWWRRPLSRRCFEVALEGGGHVVVFEDLQSGEWFLQNP